jgi:hypothetical protein
MRILGVTASAFYDPAAFELIQTSIVSSATPSVTFNNLDAYASEYKHLQIRAVVTANSPTRYGFTLNGVNTTGNYTNHYLYGISGTSTAQSGGHTSSSNVSNSITIGANSSTNASTSVTDITDAFSTTRNKTIRSLTGFTGTSSLIVMYSGLFLSTSQISSMTLLATEGNSGNFQQGSRFSIYGIRG